LTIKIDVDKDGEDDIVITAPDGFSALLLKLVAMSGSAIVAAICMLLVL